MLVLDVSSFAGFGPVFAAAYHEMHALALEAQAEGATPNPPGSPDLRAVVYEATPDSPNPRPRCLDDRDLDAGAITIAPRFQSLHQHRLAADGPVGQEDPHLKMSLPPSTLLLCGAPA